MSLARIDPASIAFDIDDVFADTVSLFLDIARTEYRIDGIRYEDITSYMIEDCIDIDTSILEEIFDKIIVGNHTPPLRPLKGAAAVVRRISRESSPVLFVTARPRLDTITAWIQQELALAPERVEVIATGSFDGKTEVLSQKGISYFVEDRLETCFLLEEAGITPILYRRPWNRNPHPFVEVGSWAELEEMIEFDEKKE